MQSLVSFASLLTMKRVLFLTAPNMTLFQPKLYQELSWGASLVAGALENAGFIVDFYDLNAALARIRGDRHLTDWEKKVFTEIFYLKEEFCNPGRCDQLNSLLDKLVSLIDQTKTYDCIAISLDKKGYNTASCRSVFNFSALLVNRLKKWIKAPVVVGGKDVFKELGKKYINSAFDEIPELPFDSFFMANAHDSFAKELSLYFKGEGQIGRERYIDTKSTFKSSALLPKYDVRNEEHLKIPMRDLFPPEILRKYPQLLDVDSMMIVPYRISMGCPYRCAFCDQGRDPIVRIHDVDQIVDTLSAAEKKGYSNFRWYDDNINLGIKFPEMLAEKIIASNLNILFSDSANMKHTSLDLFKKLRKAGCVKLWYGSESVSPRILKLINKGTKVEDVYRTLNAGKEAGIWNGLNLIIAFPHETEEDFQILKKFLIERKDLYEAWEVNIYRLLSGTTYEVESEKMGIKIRYSSDSNRISAFDEVGGMPWEERMVNAERKMLEVMSIYPPARILLQGNDYLLYSMVRAGFNKQQCLTIFDEMYNLYSRDNHIDYIIYRLERAVEDDRMPEIGPHIMGHVITDPKESNIVGGTLRPY